jgi:hypothetical protein
VRRFFTSVMETGALNFTFPTSSSFESDSTYNHATTVKLYIKVIEIEIEGY